MNIEAVFHRYERGEISRRQALLTLGACLGAGQLDGQERRATFEAKGLNHLALHVTDVERSVAFYEDHLGLRTTSRSASSAFLDCGEHFVALFKNEKPGLAHFSLSIDGYDQGDAAARLRAVGLEPRLRGNRIYFDDPDRLEVQLSQTPQ